MGDVRLDNLERVVLRDGLALRALRYNKDLEVHALLLESEDQFILSAQTPEGAEVLELGTCDLQTATQRLLAFWDTLKYEAMLRGEGHKEREKLHIPARLPHAHKRWVTHAVPP